MTSTITARPRRPYSAPMTPRAPRANQMLVYLEAHRRYGRFLAEDPANDIICDPPVQVAQAGWWQVTQRETGTRPHIWKVK